MRGSFRGFSQKQNRIGGIQAHLPNKSSLLYNFVSDELSLS